MTDAKPVLPHPSKRQHNWEKVVWKKIGCHMVLELETEEDIGRNGVTNGGNLSLAF